MPLQPDQEHAGSPVIGAVLLVGITVVLAMIVLLMCSGFRLPAAESAVPDIFRITSVTFISDSSGSGVRGYVTLTNTRDTSYRNRYLSVITHINGARANCNIPTLNNELFCSLNHYGVWHLYGVGTRGNKNFPTSVWPGNSDISIEYRKGIIRPGDTITIEVVDTTSSRIISRDTFPHATVHDAGWFYAWFLTPQSA